jgi:hypothetical protein
VRQRHYTLVDQYEGNTKLSVPMGIQNSLDFSYANVKSRNLQTTTKSADSCLMQFGIIKHLLTGYLSNRKGIIALGFVMTLWVR